MNGAQTSTVQNVPQPVTEIDELFHTDSLPAEEKTKTVLKARANAVDKYVPEANIAEPDGADDAADSNLVLPADYEQILAQPSIVADQQELPVVYDEMFHGLAGRVVKRLAPETEAHPVSLLIEVLANFGSVIGRTAHFQVEDTPHFGNLFVARVGQSSVGRKGTGSDRITAFFKQVDSAWTLGNRVNGLSSGEGLIYRIRDEVENEKGKVVDKGVEDKRLLVREPEFAAALKVMQREGNTLSPIVRSGWDGKDLEILTKNSPLQATDPHISIVGDITVDELRQLLSFTDTVNGFANRFLWPLTSRVRSLPEGGQVIDWKDESDDMKRSIDFARKQKRMFRDHNARRMWARVYPKLSEGNSGAFGAATSRGAAQVVRLSMLFALLDRSESVRVEHLRAALALWRYCEESARKIFGGLTKEQIKLFQHIKAGSKTIAQLRSALHGHRRVADILIDLAALENRRLVQLEKDGLVRAIGEL